MRTMWIGSISVILVTILSIGYGEDPGKNAAIFLSMLGGNIKKPDKDKKPLTGMRIMVDSKFVRYADVEHVIPFYCDDLTLMEPYISKRVFMPYVEDACEWLKLTTAKFLIRYGTPTPPGFPTGFSDRIVWGDQSIPYTHVEWLIPNVCSNKTDQHPFTETQQRLLDQTCSFFFNKVDEYLLAISPRRMTKEALEQRIDQCENMTLEQATPIIRYICVMINRGQPHQGRGHLTLETCNLLKEIGGYE